MKALLPTLLLLGLAGPQLAAAQDDAPRQLGGAPTLPTPAPTTAPAPRQLNTVPNQAVPVPVAPAPATVASDSTTAAPAGGAVGSQPATTPQSAPFGRPYVLDNSAARPTRYQVGLKTGQVVNAYSVETKSPLFGRSYLLLDGQQHIDMGTVGFYEDETGHYVRTTLPGSGRETTLRREKTGRISLYALYTTSYSGPVGYSPYGYGGGGFGYPYGYGGYPYGGYRTTKTEYFSKDNGPVQNLNTRNLNQATQDNPVAQALITRAGTYRNSIILSYVAAGGLAVAALLQTTSGNSQGFSPLFLAAPAVLIIPLVLHGKQDSLQRQAINVYNGMPANSR